MRELREPQEGTIYRAPTGLKACANMENLGFGWETK